MPYSNLIRQDQQMTYYHVYNRGAGKQVIFHDEQDYLYFSGLFSRYLSSSPQIGKDRMQYPHLALKIELLCYCLMPNHFHMLVYQHEARALAALMRSLTISYSRYYNLRYDRRGVLFETRYKASVIDNDSYLQHISRYIHRNPPRWKRYPYSSIGAYNNGHEAPEWLQPARVLDLFGSLQEYTAFLEAYQPVLQTSDV